jgi:hypothetical protein
MSPELVEGVIVKIDVPVIAINYLKLNLNGQRTFLFSL